MTGFPLIIAFVAAVVLMIIAISKFKIHPFISIMGISLILGLVAGIPIVDTTLEDGTTVSGIVAPLLPLLGLDSPIRTCLACMAIGAGAMTVSHANDSFFWVVTNFGAMTPDQGYKTQTVNTLILGVSVMVEIFLLSLILH